MSMRKSIKNKRKKRSSKKKRNSDKKNKSNNNNNSNKNVNEKQRECPKTDCECWIRLLKYCEYFKIDNSVLDDNEDLDKISEKISQKKQATLDSDMADLWQHYLYYHQGQNNYQQCHLRTICPFIKAQQQQHDNYHFYRKNSWNLMQTMHVYFYHTNEYIQSRNSSTRKHRYIRQKQSFRIRQQRPITTMYHIQPYQQRKQQQQQQNIRQSIRNQQKKKKPNISNIQVNLSVTSISTDFNVTPTTDTPPPSSSQSIKKTKIGPGFSHSNDDEIKYNTDDDNDDDDDDMDDILSKATKLTPTDYYAIEYQSTTTSLPLRVLEFGKPFTTEKQQATFKNPKQEILNNTFCKIEKKEWNELLKTCIEYSKKRKAKEIKLKLAEVIALKLYTDFDELQREYRKCYRENQEDRLNRQKQFYHWNNLLNIAVSKSMDVITDTVYHGVNDAFNAPSYSGSYYGPISTTTLFDIAKQFAGSNGRIFELYPSFGRRGLKVSWLSNFPDEDEILYMNTSFQVVNIYNSDHSKPSSLSSSSSSPLSSPIDNQQILFETTILKSIQIINIESNIISFSTMNNDDILTIYNDLNFCSLFDSEQICILYLLYLQYNPKDWNKFWNRQQQDYKRIAFAKYRDQFIVLAKNVKAIRMERLPMLIQHFFAESHKKYQFPFEGGIEIQEGIDNVKQKFTKNKPLRFETITRLFPNAQQLLINGLNFDWTLERLIKFMNKYEIDSIGLQEISIVFIPQYPDFNIKYESNEKEASKRLQAGKAHKNISRLRKMGWIFETSCHLRRVGFEPLSELPFLLVFVNSDNDNNKDDIFYKTYSRKILNVPHLSSNYSVTASRFHRDSSFTMDRAFYHRHSSLFAGYIQRQSNKNNKRQSSLSSSLFTPNSLSLPQHTTKSNAFTFNPMTPNSPDAMPILNEGLPSYERSTSSHQINAPHPPPHDGLPSHDGYDDNKYNNNDMDNDEKYNIQQIEGQNTHILNYNPKNCILSKDIINKLEYKKQLITTLKWRLQHPNLKSPNDYIKKKFIKYCNMVQVLKIDPIHPDLQKVFTVTPNSTPIISFENIFKLFPYVTDIFLRNTRLNLRIIYRIKKFVENNIKTSKVERIFFCKQDKKRIDNAQIPTLQEILKTVGWGFQQSEQMVVKNI